MQKDIKQRIEASTQTQSMQPSSYVPRSSQSTILTGIENKHYFSQFSLYCSRRGKHSPSTNNYPSNLLPIAELKSLQEFFEYFLAIKKPSQLLVDSKIMLFYKNCKPFWQEWLDSGCLLIKFRNNKQEEQKLLDIIWEYLCYALIGNNIDTDVIGISMGKREKITLLEIWLKRNDRAKQIQVALESQIKKQLPIELGGSLNRILKVKYKKHSDSITTNSTIKGAQNLTHINLRKGELNNSF